MKRLLTTLAAVSILTIFTQSKAHAATQQPYNATIRVNYNGRGGVNLIDSQGHYQNQYVYNNQTYKTFAKQTRNNADFYKLGTDSQWIPAQFAAIEVGSSTAEQTKITLPAGYTAKRVLNATNHRISSAEKSALVQALIK